MSSTTDDALATFVYKKLPTIDGQPTCEDIINLSKMVYAKASNYLLCLWETNGVHKIGNEYTPVCHHPPNNLYNPNKSNQANKHHGNSSRKRHL
eukprot:10684681-Ditylum_brightwellii.AAC.1